MESSMQASSEPKGRNAPARADSVRSLSCYSVDENVLEVLWDEEVDMEELLEFSFDQIDKLAERRGKTIATTEKLRLWEYVQQMRCEQPYWVTKESVPWDEVQAKYSLPSRSLSSGSFHSHLELSGTGLATPPPLLYSLSKPLPRTSRTAAANESHEEALPSPLKGPEKKRPTGFLRRSLRRVATATRKRDSRDVKTDI
ncbi:uncharacterized protein [Dermacentor albipictus]|uniref:uncharacterized protein isoform X2 n=1 Tax=Dermacentor albipictus TaxID=60249 RepID=UPI0038FCD43C